MAPVASPLACFEDAALPVHSEAKLAAALDAASEERVAAEAALREAAESECGRRLEAAEREHNRQLEALRESHATVSAEREELSDAVESECRRLYAALQEKIACVAAAEQRMNAEAARTASWEERCARERARADAGRSEVQAERRGSHARSQQFEHLEQRCLSLTKQAETLEARLERSEGALAKKRAEYGALAKQADSLRADRDLAMRCGFSLCQKLQQVPPPPPRPVGQKSPAWPLHDRCTAVTLPFPCGHMAVT